MLKPMKWILIEDHFIFICEKEIRLTRVALLCPFWIVKKKTFLFKRTFFQPMIATFNQNIFVFIDMKMIFVMSTCKCQYDFFGLCSQGSGLRKYFGRIFINNVQIKSIHTVITTWPREWTQLSSIVSNCLLWTGQKSVYEKPNGLCISESEKNLTMAFALGEGVRISFCNSFSSSIYCTWNSVQTVFMAIFFGIHISLFTPQPRTKFANETIHVIYSVSSWHMIAIDEWLKDSHLWNNS